MFFYITLIDLRSTSQAFYKMFLNLDLSDVFPISLRLWTFLGQGASLVAKLVRNVPAMCETWVRSPGWEDALEKGKATHSRILA